MMTPNAQMVPESQRVSILERLVPSLGLTVAAMSGAVGAILLVQVLSNMKQAETAGYAAFFGGMAEVEMVVGVLLGIAGILCAFGILVSTIRLFTVNTTSSPSGILLFALGLLSLVPPFAMHYILHVMKGFAANPTSETGGVSAMVGRIDFVTYFSIGSACVIALILLAFAFIPFSSKSGRKASTLIGLILVTFLIFLVMSIFFWEARTSLIERDRDRVEEYSQPIESPTLNSTNSNGGFRVETNVDTPDVPRPRHDANTKMISGGVLNGKATDLPKPDYPSAARAVRAAGAVNIQVTVSEDGEVTSAEAVSGHPLLRAVATQAARKAKFSPTVLNGQKVKVTGIIVYNFVP